MSNDKELVGELRAFHVMCLEPHCDHSDATESEHCAACQAEFPCSAIRAADALEAATRERAAVPDAAKTIAELKEYSMRTVNHGLKVIDQRDAALAAVERVRAIHAPEVLGVHEGYGEEVWCPVCEHHYPCPTVAALDGAPERLSNHCQECGAWGSVETHLRGCSLDGAPEPEGRWEYRVEYQVPGGETHVTRPRTTFEGAYGFMLENIHGGTVMGRTKAIPAGPWLPAEGEKP